VAGKTEWKIDVILPVVLDTTMVASVKRPATTALDEAKTAMGFGGELWDGGGVVACGAMMGTIIDQCTRESKERMREYRS
jgi:H+/gluconate symporter-like permease